jgi:hypothetical protein
MERDVLKLMLQGSCPRCTALRNQLTHLRETERDFTGAGFFLRMKYQSAVVPVTELKHNFMGSAVADVDGFRNVVGFLLIVINGLVDTLEGWSIGDDEWWEHGLFYRVYDPTFCDCWKDLPLPLLELSGP